MAERDVDALDQLLAVAADLDLDLLQDSCQCSTSTALQSKLLQLAEAASEHVALVIEQVQTPQTHSQEGVATPYDTRHAAAGSKEHSTASSSGSGSGKDSPDTQQNCITPETFHEALRMLIDVLQVSSPCSSVLSQRKACVPSTKLGLTVLVCPAARLWLLAAHGGHCVIHRVLTLLCMPAHSIAYSPAQHACSHCRAVVVIEQLMPCCH